MAAQMQRMRSQPEQLQSELLYFRNGGAPLDELQVLRHRISLPEASNAELRQRQTTCEHPSQRALDAQVYRDELILKIESFCNGKPWNEIDNSSDKMQEVNLVKSYVSKIQELEAEIFRLQSLLNAGHNGLMDCLDLDVDPLQSKDTLSPAMHPFSSSSDYKSAVGSGELSAEVESDVKEQEHSTLQEKFGRELQELKKQLEQKEAEMEWVSKGDTTVLEQHYGKKILELEHEKKALQVSDLKRKQEAQSQLLRQKQKSDDAAKRSQEKIQRMKSQKVHLQQKIKQESEQFRSWKASREKEVLQAEMERVSKGDTTVLEQHYGKKILELEHEKKALQIEIVDLRSSLANISSASGDDAQKLKESYLQKLNVLEAQVSDLNRKQEAQSQLLRQKQKSDDAAKRSQEKIQRMKSQKESEQFRSWKASREKEVLQLKKECRRNEYEMHKLLALNQRQKMVLQRKTEEASLATRRLKELLEAKKASSRESSGNASGPGMQALMQTIEHDIEVILRVHEVRSKYERQLEARVAMANELIKLKDDAEALRKNTSGCTQTMSPSARNLRISALENMIAVSSSTLVSMASHLSEAEERERLFSGKNRWNQVRSLAEAKNLLNYLFDIVTSSRCQLLDRDVTCFEKDSTIKELTEKVVRLTSLLRQSEIQKIEIQQKLQKLELEMQSTNVIGSLGSLASNSVEAGHIYELRKASRRFQFFHGAGYSSLDIHEVMDTSDSDLDKDWVESGKKLAERRFSGANRSEKAASAGSHIQEENLDVPAVAVQMEGKPDSESFCFCTKSSKCKTQNCRCRATNRICGKSCGCVPRKCVNRRKNKAFVDLKMVDESTELAAHGAMGLRSAFSMNAAGEEVQQRRPLSDIGNVVATPNASKPNREKKVANKLPRAMRSQPLNSQPLGEDSILADESSGNTDVGAGIIPPKSPSGY